MFKTQQEAIKMFEAMVAKFPDMKEAQILLEQARAIKTENEWKVWWTTYCAGIGHGLNTLR